MRKTPERLILVFALCLVPAALLAQDMVIKTDGGRLRGKIVSESNRGVKIKTLGGTYFVRRDEIAELRKDGDVFKQFEAKKERLRSTDAEGWYRLGVWCQDRELYPQAIDCFHTVIGIDRDHEEARWELGYRRLNGKWVTEEEYYTAKGYVRWEDRWVTQSEYDKLNMGLVKVDGRWIKPASEPDPGRSRPEPRAVKKPKRSRRHRGTTKPAAAARRKGMGRFPWAGRNRPLGGQVGLPRLTPEQRKQQLQANKQRGGWAVAWSSKYYDLYSNGPEDEVHRLGRTMDLMCDQYKKIFKFSDEITRPFPIHLYGSQQEFMSRTGKGPGVGGYYDGSKIVAFHGRLGNLTTTSVLFHEGTHQFQGLVLGRNMWRAKIWLIEGLAVFFEASKVRGRKHLQTGVIPKGRLANVKRAIRSGTYVHLHDLIRMDQRQFGAIHYAHAWSLIYFLVNGTKGGKKRFVQYWEKTKEGGVDGVKLFEELFNRPIDEIEAAWKRYVLALDARGRR